MKLALPIIFMASPLFADEPEIVSANAEPTSAGWRFEVTLKHADTGWEDYADGWRVELEDGSVLETRVLYHPHVNEQPFTRSLSGVQIPTDTATVFIRAKDNVGGWGTSLYAVRIENSAK